MRRTILPVVVAYLIATLVGLILPGLAVGLYCLLAIYLVIPTQGVDSHPLSSILTLRGTLRSDSRRGTAGANGWLISGCRTDRDKGFSRQGR